MAAPRTARSATPSLHSRPLRQWPVDPPWEFGREGEVIRIEPQARLVIGVGGATDLGVEAATAGVGVGVIHLFEDWLQPYFASDALQPVLEDWWQPFSGPFLYHSSRRLVPPPLRAFIDHIRGI